MALTVEDGSGKVGADSYASVAEADAYHLDYGNSAWSGTEAVKSAALRRATRYIDGNYRLLFKGYRLKQAQGLEWPRYGVVDSSAYYNAPEVIPKALKAAVFEAALRELVEPNVLNQDLARGGAVLSESVAAGPVNTSTTYAAGASTKTEFVVIENLLNDLIENPDEARLVRA